MYIIVITISKCKTSNNLTENIGQQDCGVFTRKDSASAVDDPLCNAFQIVQNKLYVMNLSDISDTT